MGLVGVSVDGVGLVCTTSLGLTLRAREAGRRVPDSELLRRRFGLLLLADRGFTDARDTVGDLSFVESFVFLILEGELEGEFLGDRLVAVAAPFAVCACFITISVDQIEDEETTRVPG